METNPYFLDKRGKMIKYDGVYSHIGIAEKYLDEHPELREAFERSGMKLASDFLVERLGLIQVTDDTGNGYYNQKLVFSAKAMSPEQKQLIMGYMSEGFTADNVDKVSTSLAKRFHDFEK